MKENIETKLQTLNEERETIVLEMDEIQKAYNMRQQRLIEIIGSIKTLEELLNDSTEEK